MEPGLKIPEILHLQWILVSHGFPDWLFTSLALSNFADK